MTRLSSRRGVTLVEMAIVLAIVGILAALAGPMLTETMPSWRTRRAAREFAADVMKARSLAIAQDSEYRVRLASFDNDPTNGTGIGVYYVERGNAVSNSTTWDILPWDLDGSGTESGEGTVVISEDGEDELHLVSILDWGTITGVDGNDLVFSPQGWLINPTSDFNARGYIEVTFANKAARRGGGQDDWVVQVSRGGMVRMISSRQSDIGQGNGIPSASDWTSSSGSGYSGGSSAE
jgi:prepilin-type N-terminal cleavage/methylation domain-containing protein